MIMNINLAEKSFWESINKTNEYAKPLHDNIIIKWLSKHHNVHVENKSCIEIGCFPGRYLTFFGDLGYELNGIDIIDRTSSELPSWLIGQGYKVGEFITSDFLEYNFNKKYDLVYSLGFIEHFTDWESVIIKHADLVKPGGILIIETPNFKGIVQRLLHIILDKENYKRHNIWSMDPLKWEKVLGNEFSITYSGYFYGFDFWVEKQRRNVFQKLILKILFKTLPTIKKAIKMNSKYFSPFCGLIAQRKVT